MLADEELSDLHLSNGKVTVEFVDLGEGWNGDYNPDDPNDREFLRLDVLISSQFAEQINHDETDDPRWIYPQDGSICTGVSKDTTVEQAKAHLQTALDEITDLIDSGHPTIRRVMARLSWLGMGSGV